MDYMEVYGYVSTSQALRRRSAVAIATAAANVLAEDPATANHAARLLWARSALSSPIAMAERMVFGVMANTTLQGEGDAMTDGDLQFVVNSLVDTYAALAS